MSPQPLSLTPSAAAVVAREERDGLERYLRCQADIIKNIKWEGRVGKSIKGTYSHLMWQALLLGSLNTTVIIKEKKKHLPNIGRKQDRPVLLLNASTVWINLLCEIISYPIAEWLLFKSCTGKVQSSCNLVSMYIFTLTVSFLPL